MKFRGFWYDILLLSIIALFAVIFVGVTAIVEPVLAMAEAAIALLIIAFAVYRVFTSKIRYKKFMEKNSRKLDFTDAKVLSNQPFPVAVCDSDGYIKWCTERFASEILGGNLLPSTLIEDYSNGVDIDTLINEEETIVKVDEMYYSVYTHTYTHDGDVYCVLYYLNNTRLKQTEIEYAASRPYAIVIELDSLDEMRAEYRDSEKTEIRSQIEAAIDNWSDLYNSVVKRITDDRYLIVTEQCNFNRMVEDRFSILETVRKFEYKGKKVGSTLSIGVAGGADIRACEQNARKAIEMALGRGGDQVAIKNKEGYDFIGGVSKSSEKRNKVKSRLIGSALSELIKASSNIIIMGHSYTDLDAIGAAVGIWCAASALSKPAYIVTDKSKSLATSLIEKLCTEGLEENIIGCDEALGIINKKSLLVVVDTHIESFVEFPEIYEKIEVRVIIDHHRRSATDIQNAVVIHLDPAASSASEMVTEILQYITSDTEITKPVAEALLAGIMLDTKNFVLRCGVRTFEAAAFLKEKGADTVNVKLLFANSMDVNKLRNQVVSAAETYRSCAVSTVDFDSPDIRIISAQAADELLSVSDVNASFVAYESNGTINISARSYGKINVQLIMESLGGGGHQTMAACQIKNCDIHQAVIMLHKAIDEYYSNNEDSESKEQ
ncbi:MAG: DHH family phosphoesterase [Clostridia bacterium]|nr:DHH family phosphoesterase [Clostridia bacterium]